MDTGTYFYYKFLFEPRPPAINDKHIHVYMKIISVYRCISAYMYISLYCICPLV